LVADVRYGTGVAEADPVASAEALESAARANPLVPAYRRSLGSAYGRVMEASLSSPAAVPGLTAPEAYARAEQALLRAAALAPTDYESHKSLAQLYSRAALLLDPAVAAKAVESAEEAVRLRPRGADALYELAVANREAGDATAAQRAAEAAVFVAPWYAEPYTLLGLLRQEQGDAAGAAREFRSALDRLKADDPRRAALEQALRSAEASAATEPTP
jgi:tetratricopeptide (TPR) repeat protein